MQVYYIYRITNIVEKKHYYGYRGTKINPKDDLGEKYFSSSSDKKFINLQKTNPEQFKYKIIKVFSDKKDAILMEVKLHKKFNVKSHSSFYNLSNQLSLGFAADNKGREGIKGAENGMAKEINIYNSDRELVYTSNGNFDELCKNKKLPTTMPRTSYYNDGRPIFLRKDKNTWAKKNGYSEFIGWYALYATKDNHTKEEYDELVKNEKLIIHQNSKEINVYNSDRELVYTINGVFAEFCEKHNLPKSALWNSYNKDGIPIFQTKYGKSIAIKNGHEQFIGWYAINGKKNHTENEYKMLVEEITSNDEKTQNKKSKRLSKSKPNSKTIHIFDSEGNLKFETSGNFKEIVENNNLPKALAASYRDNGKPIFQSVLAKTKAIKEGKENYIGWYAKVV